jgi:enoyl-CoA hydratase/carnithine racemase
VSDYETILLETDAQGVAWLTFNRPEKRNALDRSMVEDVRAALQSLASDGRVAALVFRGAGGKAFISGADIGQLRERTHADALRRINSDLFREIERFPAPTIAALQGWALGGGCELAMACDLRVAAESAKLGQPEVGLGIIPAAGATYRLPRLVGLGRARELIFTGRIIDAAEALSIGLVERVVPDDQLEDAVRELAGQIAKNSILAVRLAKQSLNQSLVASLDALQALESSAQGLLFDDPEKHRRMTAFLERKSKRTSSGPPALEIRGKVTKRYTYETLRDLPDAAQVADISQILPRREGRAVRLSVLLDEAQLETWGARVCSGDGGFSYEQPLESLRRAFVLYQRGGQPLAQELGGPFRLLIPDCEDRCANVKHVATIQSAEGPGESE